MKNPLRGLSEAATMAIEIPESMYIAVHATPKTQPSGVAEGLLSSGYHCARASVCSNDEKYPTTSPIAENNIA